MPSADWAPAECARWCVLIFPWIAIPRQRRQLLSVGRQCRQSVILALRPAVFDRHVAAIDVTGFTEPFEKSRQGPRVSPGKSGIEKTNHRHCAVLRARGQRPGGGNSAGKNSRRLMGCPSGRGSWRQRCDCSNELVGHDVNRLQTINSIEQPF